MSHLHSQCRWRDTGNTLKVAEVRDRVGVRYKDSLNWDPKKKDGAITWKAQFNAAAAPAKLAKTPWLSKSGDGDAACLKLDVAWQAR